MINVVILIINFQLYSRCIISIFTLIAGDLQSITCELSPLGILYCSHSVCIFLCSSHQVLNDSQLSSFLSHAESVKCPTEAKAQKKNDRKRHIFLQFMALFLWSKIVLFFPAAPITSGKKTITPHFLQFVVHFRCNHSK